MTVPRRSSRALVRRNASQADFAYIYGVSQPTVHKYVTTQPSEGN